MTRTRSPIGSTAEMEQFKKQRERDKKESTGEGESSERIGMRMSMDAPAQFQHRVCRVVDWMAGAVQGSWSSIRQGPGAGYAGTTTPEVSMERVQSETRKPFGASPARGSL